MPPQNEPDPFSAFSEPDPFSGAMLDGFRASICKLKAEGKTLEQVLAAAPTAAFDKKLGGAFIKPAQLVGFIYETVD